MCATSLLRDESGRIRALWRVLVAIGANLLLAAPIPLFITGLIHGPKLNLEELFLLVSLAVLVPLGLNKYLDHRPKEAIGWQIDRQSVPDFIFGAILGITLIGIQLFLYIGAGHTAEFPAVNLTLLVTIAGNTAFHSLVAVTEELRYRGHLLTTVTEWTHEFQISRYFSIGFAIFLVSLIFALFHLPSSPVRVISLFSSGIVYALAYVLTGRLAIAIGAHLTNNVMANVVNWDSRADFPIGISIDGFGFSVQANFYIDILFFHAVIELVLGTILVLLWVNQKYSKTSIWSDFDRSYTQDDRV